VGFTGLSAPGSAVTAVTPVTVTRTSFASGRLSVAIRSGGSCTKSVATTSENSFPGIELG